MESKKFDLVFEGGGAKGMVFVGACQEFFKQGHKFDRLLGTSAGAITAVLLAAGYTPEEMLEALVEKADGKSVFSQFMGAPKPFSEKELADSAMMRFLNAIDFKFVLDYLEKKAHAVILSGLASNETFRHVVSLIERGGWFSADKFVEWLSKKLDSGKAAGKQRTYSGMTLKQFYEATKVELSFVASDTSGGDMLVLNHRTAPDCPVVWGVRMSMSIPLLWEEVIWQGKWGLYNKRNITGHAIVDGGLLSNFPIELFISEAPHVLELMGQKRDGVQTLGLLIDENVPVPTETKGVFVDFNMKVGELRTLQRLQRLVDTATGAHDKMVIEEYENLVVRLPAKGYGTTEFDMSDERRTLLVKAGQLAMNDYFVNGSKSSFLELSKGAGADSQVDRTALRMLK
jgi:NTE family protein